MLNSYVRRIVGNETVSRKLLEEHVVTIETERKGFSLGKTDCRRRSTKCNHRRNWGFREKIKTKEEEEEEEYKRNAPHAYADYPVAVTAESFNFWPEEEEEEEGPAGSLPPSSTPFPKPVASNFFFYFFFSPHTPRRYTSREEPWGSIRASLWFI